MHHIALTALVISALLSCCAIGFLLASASTSKLLLAASLFFALAGAISAGLGIGESILVFWAFFFAAAALGCGLSAALRLFARSTRWIHRFVIYDGYAATFALMGAAALFLSSRNLSGRLAAVILALTYIVGSLGIFLAKTLIVRVAARTMPEYQASLSSAPGNQGQSYW
jgi:hypothetical protein